MTDDLLVKYIKEMLAVGNSVEIIKEGVKDKGGDPALVDEIIANRNIAIDRVQQAVAEAKANIDEIHQYIESHKSIVKGTIAAVVAAVIGGGLWILIVIGSNLMIPYLSCGLGIMIGVAMRRFGRGFDNKFRINAALVTLCALFFANAIIILYVFAKHFDVPMSKAIRALSSKEFYIFALYVHDLIMYICYVAAVLCAWWFGAHKLNDELILEYAILVKLEKKA